MNRRKMITKKIRKTDKKRSIYAERENKEYETLSEQIRINIAKGAKVWIPELCEKLKKKYLPENELTEEEIRERNRRIQDRVVDDWGNGKPWIDVYVRQCMPDEIKNPNMVRVGIEHGARNLEKANKVKEERRKIKQGIESAFKPIPQPPKEVVEEIKEEVEEQARTESGEIPPSVVFPAREIPEPEEYPEELHDEAMRAYARIWHALAGIDHLPATSTDIFVEVIKPSRDRRLKILKGMDETRSVGFMNQSKWLYNLLKDFIEMDRQLEREQVKPGK